MFRRIKQSNDQTVKQSAFPRAVAAAVLFGTLSASAVTLSVDRVQQRYPWNGLVDIDYTIAGLDAEADPNDYVVSLGVSGTTNSVPFSFTASNFVNCAWCDLPSSNGTFRITWNSASDGVEILAASAKFKLTLTKDVVAESEAEYMIVDLTQGGVADAPYPVRYVRTTGMPTSQFNWPVYKTDKLVLKRVKAGVFTMGNAQTGEAEYHTVRLSKDYFLGVFLITQRQYYHVIRKNPSSNTKLVAEEPWNVPAMRPVEQINHDTWMAADGFMSTMNVRARKGSLAVDGFWLPTEAQWEYACRAGTDTKYFWGTDASLATLYGWYSDDGRCTHAVGYKLSNPWGFYDVDGNVHEACSDLYGAYQDDPRFVRDGETVDPQGVTSSSNWISRGSSYVYSGCFTSGCRDARQATWACYYMGARLAKTIVP